MNTRMNNCDEIPKLFSLDLDNELDAPSRERMNRHLTDCCDCANLVARMRVVDRMFRDAPMRYAPLGFTERTVSMTFDADLRRNVGIGLGILLMGTMLLSSLFVLGRVDLLWMALSFIVSPSIGAAWLNQVITTVNVAGNALWTGLGIFFSLLTGPLLVPSLISILAALFVTLFLRRTSARGSISA